MKKTLAVLGLVMVLASAIPSVKTGKKNELAKIDPPITQFRIDPPITRPW